MGTKIQELETFLKALKVYVKTMEVRENEILPLLLTYLRKVAQSWLHLVDDKIENLNDFG